MKMAGRRIYFSIRKGFSALINNVLEKSQAKSQRKTRQSHESAVIKVKRGYKVKKRKYLKIYPRSEHMPPILPHRDTYLQFHNQYSLGKMVRH